MNCPNPNDKPPKKWETKYLTVWDVTTKTHVTMTLVESVKDVVANWDAIDYGVDAGAYEEDPQGVKSAMKKLGYYPEQNYQVSREGNKIIMTQVDGKHRPRGGSYYFQHYTKRKKKLDGEGTSS